MKTQIEQAGAAQRMAPPLAQADQDRLERLFGDWEWIASSEKSMPPVSPLVFQLLATNRDSPLAMAQMTEIIESDPIVTARILGLANAAAFLRAGKPIRDVQSAVMRLGVHNAFEVTFTELFGVWVRHSARSPLPDDALLDGLWLEYLLTAFCTREIAATLNDHAVDPSAAYTAGLLHDIGTLALCWAEPVSMGRFVRNGYAAGTPLHDQFVDAHCGLGAALLRSWNAPRELADVAARHHEALATQSLATTAVVYIADHLHEAVLMNEKNSFHPAHMLPLGCYGSATEEVSAAIAALGLTDRIEGIIERVAGQGSRIEALSHMGG